MTSALWTRTKSAAVHVGARGSGRSRTVVLLAVLAVLCVLIAAPMAYLVFGSFRSGPPGSRRAQFTLDKYLGLFDVDFARLAWTTFGIALGSTALALTIGLCLGIIIIRTNVPRWRLLDAAVVVPAYIAPFIGAIAWILLLSPQIGYLNTVLKAVGLAPLNIYTTGGIIFVMGLYFAPVAYLYVRPALIAFDSSLDESARVFGATRGRSLLRIGLPLILPAIVSSVLVVFVNAAGQFGIPGVLGKPASIEVVATRLVRLTTRSPADVNTAAVLGLVLTLVTVLGLSINRRILRGRDYASVGSRGSVGVRIELDWLRYVALGVSLLYVVTAVVLPLGAMLIGSLQPYVSPDFSSGWTVANYVELFTDERTVNSIWNSVLLASSAAVIGSVLAAVIAVLLVRVRSRLTGVVDYITSLPLAVPSSVFGLALLWMWVFVSVGVYGTHVILFFCYLALFLPYALRATVTAVQQIHESIEDAGRVFGATWLGVARKLLFPLLVPGMLSGATIILYQSMRELAASLLLYTPSSEVMSVLMWDEYDTGEFVHLFALGTINVLIVFVLVAAATRLTGGTSRR